MIVEPYRHWNVFKQIFTDHWDVFKVSHPRYNTRYYDGLVEKMQGSGDPDKMGYIEYRCQHSNQELAEERQRVDPHRERFRFEVRSVRKADAQLDRLLQQWRAIPPNSTG